MKTLAEINKIFGMLARPFTLETFVWINLYWKQCSDHLYLNLHVEARFDDIFVHGRPILVQLRS